MKTLLDLMRRQIGPNILDIKMLTLSSLVFVWSLQHSEFESKNEKRFQQTHLAFARKRNAMRNRFVVLLLPAVVLLWMIGWALYWIGDVRRKR